MYSQSLKEIVDSISEISNPGEVYDLIDRGMRCYLDSIADQINGTLSPSVNRSDTLIQASLLSSTIANNPQLLHIEKLHYLVGMILEQQGGLIARSYMATQMNVSPEENDYWYHLTLAFLHYLAGGYRIQAKTIVNNLGFTLSQTQDEQYKKAFNDIKKLFSDQFDYERELFFIQKEKITNLINQIQSNRVANLTDLGLNVESEWLMKRGINTPEAITFWNRYLQELTLRGITTFTKEQINNDFDSWLRIDNDLLVVLPTGSGKTIFGELKTALTLANGKQVVWLLPMRSLVRQTQIEMSKAFNSLNITVQELPTTDDYIPWVSEINYTEPMVAITTPEKFLALIRINEDALKNIGLVVVDEAQNLFENRGFAIESNLFQITTKNPECKIVFLSAMADKAPKLIEFYNRLRPGKELTQIISSNRPTRCSYGILTSFQDQTQSPALVCYSALESDTQNLQQPRTIFLPKTRGKNWLDTSTLIKNFIKNSQRSSLRSIIFVNRRDSTETRAREFSKDLEEIAYPEEALFDLARIKIERGESSPFEDSFKHEIAPHHGSLPKIEQIFIEKWIRKGFIKHVIATPTLAQGVNLPFDISIITFLTRYVNGASKELSQAEVMNMLGRAGRAGMVSDGLALIAQKNYRSDNDARAILNHYRQWFFHNESTSERFIGLSRILVNLLKDDFDPQNWIEELSGFDFSEAMSLNILLAKVCAENSEGNLEHKLKDEIGKYPSINDLQNSVGPDQDISAFFAGILAPIITELSTRSPEILQTMAFTGLPAEFITSLIEKLHEVDFNEIDDPLSFGNEIIQQSLITCSARNWYISFSKLTPTKSFDFNEGFTAVKGWLIGNTWNEIAIGFINSFQNDLISTGSFLNNKLPQFAQFWGCLAVCEKILFGLESHQFDLLQPFIRNGVNSKQKLIVLKEIGNNDRVFAHKITPYFDLNDEDNIADIQKSVQQQLKIWKLNTEIIPPGLGLDEVMALKSILNDLYIP
ncbi:MAG: DEAD/DEAH box helicase [Chloroflexota bacterium]